MRLSIVSVLLVGAAAAFVLSESSCKSSSSNPVNPTDTTKKEVTTFGFKVGATYQFLWFQVNDSSHTIDSTQKLVFERIVATGLTYDGKTGVVMAIDSIVPLHTTGITFDTVYYWTDGRALAQYGFVASLVKVFSNGLLSVTPKWNTLVDTLPFWTTDTTTAMFGTVLAQETTTAVDQGVQHDSLAGKNLRVRAAEHSGKVIIPFGTVNFPFSVSCSYDPTAVLLMVAAAVDVPGFGYRVPQTQRVLVTYALP
jgi:hypothetical protein